MKALKFILLPIVILFTTVSCNNDTINYEIDVPNEVIQKITLLKESVLSQLQHQDSFKIKTSQVFLENLKYQKNVKGLRYNSYKDIINKFYHNDDSLVIMINNIKKNIPQDTETYDALSINSKLLIENIEETYKTYLKCNWKHKISFDNYCQYILPYKSNKSPQELNWRKTLQSNYLLENDSSIFKSNIDSATIKIHHWLYGKKKKFRAFFGSKNLNIPDFSYDILDRLGVGSCHEMTTLGVGYMRALGIPAAIDFTPNYTNIDSGHEWGAVVLDSLNNIPFDINHDAINKIKSDYFVFSKVYRRSFIPDPNSHFTNRGYCDFLPELFNDPFITDVTKSYTKTANVQIPVINNIKSNFKFCYLGVFNRATQSWTLVSWGKIYNKHALFKNVGTGGVYLAVSVESNGSFVVNSPFIVNKNGEIKFLTPKTSNMETIVLRRKLYSNPDKELHKSRMIGGKFQVANEPNFKNAKTLYTIQKNPGDYFNEIKLSENQSKKYRYVRYLSPKDSYGNVGEIEFYETGKDSIIKGKIIGTDGSFLDIPNCKKEAVFDSDVLSYFDSNKGDFSWVGLDLVTPRKISKIRFIARNDMNCVQIGNLYELFFWQNGWKSLGKKKANKTFLMYTNVPKNALLWLRNLTEGVEERIFTYENGRQVWW